MRFIRPSNWITCDASTESRNCSLKTVGSLESFRTVSNGDNIVVTYFLSKQRATQRPGVSRRHRPDRQPSKLTPNSGEIGGRLHAGLGGRLY